MKYKDLDYPTYESRELGPGTTNTLTAQNINNYYLSGDYDTYFIEYFGDISSAIANIDYADVYIPQKFFAILFVQKGMLNTLLENVPEIIGVQPNVVYTLSELITNSDIGNEAPLYTDSIPLDGEGTIVGIIGTGIDYLNPRFITETGESRVAAIWDQSLNNGPTPEFFPYGTEYSKADINNEIRSNVLGETPYEIVAHRDEVGHGTAIAGLIGGRNLGGEDRLKSIAPKCEFAIVKLQEAREEDLELSGIDPNTKNVYSATAISSAIRYLSDLQQRLRKPMVVYLPLGTNYGGRDGGTIVERYIDNLTQRRDFSIVTDTGNQGTGRTHASGIIEATGDTQEIFVNVAPAQSSLNVSIHTRRPDIVSVSITSPSGANINKIPIPSINEQRKYLTFQENGINIDYFAQETLTGSVSINMLIKNTVEGIWKISLFGDYIVSGLYDSWIPQSELLKGDTRFLDPDPNTTLLTPCTAINIITTSCYNQINDTVIQSSGRGLPRNGKIEPSLTNGGVNLLTVGLDNSLILGTGGAMAGAILAGAVALIYQWGIVQGNFTQLFPPRVKNFLIASTIRDDIRIYPNDQWGYGKLSIDKLYEVLFRTSNISNARNHEPFFEDESLNYLYINIPMEIYKRFKKSH
ncbi:S8 family peptidase [Clostridium sp.]|uniref:S8 family peptidase n=1 Tax=Clostridium sp. TaxID=1506 RepID=UPI002FCC114E